jgi:hypothetical protein
VNQEYYWLIEATTVETHSVHGDILFVCKTLEEARFLVKEIIAKGFLLTDKKRIYSGVAPGTFRLDESKLSAKDGLKFFEYSKVDKGIKYIISAKQIPFLIQGVK